MFARVHPTAHFPTFSVLYMGTASAICCLLDLDALINTVTILYLMIAAVPMVPAVTLLRRRPGIARPFRMWLYPLPSMVALAGWIFVITTSGWQYIASGAGVIVAGTAAYLWRARQAREWPFDHRLGST
jgi:amino acid transporter